MKTDRFYSTRKFVIACFLLMFSAQCLFGHDTEGKLSQELAFVKQYRIAKVDFLDVPLEEVVNLINKEIKEGQEELGVQKEKILIVKFCKSLDEKAREQTIYVALKNSSLEVIFGAIFDQTSITYRIERGSFVLTK